MLQASFAAEDTLHQFNKMHGALQNYTAAEGVEQIHHATGENIFR